LSELRPYECMVILDPELDEEEIRPEVDRWMSSLEAQGAERGYVDHWGRRRLAYEVKHRKEGYYVVFQARATPASMGELSRVLSLHDGVLRHKVLRVPEKAYGPPTQVSSPPAAE
jgi:small subunit ribosomal protein S6